MKQQQAGYQTKYTSQLRREYKALGLANRIKNKQRRKEWRSAIMKRINILRRRQAQVLAFLAPEYDRPESRPIAYFGRIR